LVGDGGKRKLKKIGTYLRFTQKIPNNKHKHSKGVGYHQEMGFYEIWKKSWGGDT
jgi:hypothetical protein